MKMCVFNVPPFNNMIKGIIFLIFKGVVTGEYMSNMTLFNNMIKGIIFLIFKGVVTGEDVFNVLPFNNTVDHGLISGADLLRVLEDGVKGTSNKTKNGFLAPRM